MSIWAHGTLSRWFSASEWTSWWRWKGKQISQDEKERQTTILTQTDNKIWEMLSISANTSVDLIWTKTHDLHYLHSVPPPPPPPQLNAPEIWLLWTCRTGKSPSALFICKRQNPQKLQTPLCGHHTEFMSDSSSCPTVCFDISNRCELM